MMSAATLKLVVTGLSGAAAAWSCYNAIKAGNAMPWNIASALTVGAFLFQLW